jgi:hypothetical protein
VRSYAGAEGGCGEWEDEAEVGNGKGSVAAGKTARGEARSASVKKSRREWEGERAGRECAIEFEQETSRPSKQVR